MQSDPATMTTDLAYLSSLVILVLLLLPSIVCSCLYVNQTTQYANIKPNDTKIFFTGNDDLCGLFVDDFALWTSVRTLILEGNMLTTLPLGIFDYNPLLEEVDLSGNPLFALPLGIFRNNSHIQKISFGDNDSLHCEDPELTACSCLYLSYIGYLEFYRNSTYVYCAAPTTRTSTTTTTTTSTTTTTAPICVNLNDTAEYYNLLPTVTIIDLSNLHVCEFPVNSLASFSKLNVLYLSGNFITTLPLSIFDNNPYLQAIYLWSNRFLTALPLGLCRNQKYFEDFSSEGSVLSCIGNDCDFKTCSCAHGTLVRNTTLIYCDLSTTTVTTSFTTLTTTTSTVVPTTSNTQSPTASVMTTSTRPTVTTKATISSTSNTTSPLPTTKTSTATPSTATKPWTIATNSSTSIALSSTTLTSSTLTASTTTSTAITTMMASSTTSTRIITVNATTTFNTTIPTLRTTQTLSTSLGPASKAIGDKGIRISLSLMIGIAVASVIMVVGTMLIALYLAKRRTRKHHQYQPLVTSSATSTNASDDVYDEEDDDEIAMMQL